MRLALSASPEAKPVEEPPSPLAKFGRWIFGALIFVAMTGAWASLSNTLYPSDGILEGLIKDFSQDSHPLVRLRILHPLFATLLCSVVLLYSWSKYLGSPSPNVQRSSLAVVLVFLFAFVFGWLTLFTQAPLPMKIGHLLIAHGLWLFVINEVFGWNPRGESETEPAR